VRSSAILATSCVRSARLRRAEFLRLSNEKLDPLRFVFEPVKMNGTVLCNHCASSNRPSTTLSTQGNSERQVAILYLLRRCVYQCFRSALLG
jgi:hypothetical protein